MTARDHDAPIVWPDPSPLHDWWTKVMEHSEETVGDVDPPPVSPPAPTHDGRGAA
ncbi:hypothetical protein AAFP35_18270 [Gordonia sp. CPCC 206044]|uniref:hypothetical protein n=1 Tax=Gordonia sp. CPCC 206044 TaxID=3140793 RepID=UPI003AF39B49